MIICVCNKASTEQCGECIKDKVLKPTHQMHYDKWCRNVRDIRKLVRSEQRSGTT